MHAPLEDSGEHRIQHGLDPGPVERIEAAILVHMDDQALDTHQQGTKQVGIGLVGDQRLADFTQTGHQGVEQRMALGTVKSVGDAGVVVTSEFGDFTLQRSDFALVGEQLGAKVRVADVQAQLAAE